MGTRPLHNVQLSISVFYTSSTNFTSFRFNFKKIGFFKSSILPHHKTKRFRSSEHLYMNRTALANGLKFTYCTLLSVTTRPTTGLVEPSNFVDFFIPNSMRPSEITVTASVAIYTLFFWITPPRDRYRVIFGHEWTTFFALRITSCWRGPNSKYSVQTKHEFKNKFIKNLPSPKLKNRNFTKSKRNIPALSVRSTGPRDTVEPSRFTVFFILNRIGPSNRCVTASVAMNYALFTF
jgi:hypothetical protein